MISSREFSLTWKFGDSLPKNTQLYSGLEATVANPPPPFYVPERLIRRPGGAGSPWSSRARCRASRGARSPLEDGTGFRRALRVHGESSDQSEQRPVQRNTRVDLVVDFDRHHAGLMNGHVAKLQDAVAHSDGVIDLYGDTLDRKLQQRVWRDKGIGALGCHLPFYPSTAAPPARAQSSTGSGFRKSRTDPTSPHRQTRDPTEHRPVNLNRRFRPSARPTYRTFHHQVLRQDRSWIRRPGAAGSPWSSRARFRAS